MKKLIHRVQDLSKKAAEIRQTVQSMPGKAAELREAVVMSAGELQQIRSDVQANLSGLRATSEDRLLQAMREINDHTYVFEEAGYELTGLDLDLAITQRLAVQLQKFEDVPDAALRSLVSKQTNGTIKAILSGIIKAEETAANVELTHLKYDGVVMDVGAIPTIRMSWRSDTFAEQQQAIIETPQAAPASASSSAAASSVSNSPAFGSFFEQRTVPISAAATPAVTPAQTTVTQAETKPASTEIISSSSAENSEKSTGDWKQSALDRFKKMPDLSKSRY